MRIYLKSIIAFTNMAALVRVDATAMRARIKESEIKRNLFSACPVIEKNIDYYGNDISSTESTSAEECCDLCAATPGCALFVWRSVGGDYYCFLKHTQGAPSYLSGARSGVLETYSCPVIENNVDYWGNDMCNDANGFTGCAESASPEDCCDLCARTPGCVLFVWRPVGADYYCFLKHTQGAPSYLSGARSGVLEALEKLYFYSPSEVGSTPSYSYSY